ncbi:hypothetical protein FGO68_gene11329 [Halteria grandinella]|uniref:Uncharacterized protein n=1 Tax=Halteria grandinella TaxID=5974 RepID=A0A8J8T0V2_HALGN|nr:hypothetical protein FGO68_gene11329 [Halteria grandinella]
MGKKQKLTQNQKEQMRKEQKMKELQQLFERKEKFEARDCFALPDNKKALISQMKSKNLQKPEKKALFQQLNLLSLRADKQQSLRELLKLSHTQGLPHASEMALDATSSSPTTTDLLGALMQDIGDIAFNQQNQERYMLASIWRCLGVISFALQKSQQGVPCHQPSASQVGGLRAPTQNHLPRQDVPFGAKPLPAAPINIFDMMADNSSSDSSFNFFEQISWGSLNESQVVTRGMHKESQISRQSKSICKDKLSKPERDSERKSKAKSFREKNSPLSFIPDHKKSVPENSNSQQIFFLRDVFDETTSRNMLLQEIAMYFDLKVTKAEVFTTSIFFIYTAQLSLKESVPLKPHMPPTMFTFLDSEPLQHANFKSTVIVPSTITIGSQLTVVNFE